MNLIQIKDNIQNENDTKNEITEIEIDELIESITLTVFHEGTKQTNFRILQMIPTTVEEIMEETKLTKVPVNKHINDLEKSGLLKREKGTGKVFATDMTPLFNSLIEKIKKLVKKNVFKMLSTAV